MSEFEFEAGMSVVVRRPPKEEERYFSGTWVDGMERFDGEVGEILQTSPQRDPAGTRYYRVLFGSATSLLWDERFIEPASLTAISDEEFDSIFN